MNTPETMDITTCCTNCGTGADCCCTTGDCCGADCCITCCVSVDGIETA